MFSFAHSGKGLEHIMLLFYFLCPIRFPVSIGNLSSGTQTGRNLFSVKCVLSVNSCPINNCYPHFFVFCTRTVKEVKSPQKGQRKQENLIGVNILNKYPSTPRSASQTSKLSEFLFRFWGCVSFTLHSVFVLVIHLNKYIFILEQNQKQTILFYKGVKQYTCANKRINQIKYK